MSILICPVCKAELSDCADFHKCENGHCFDKAREGYVNLLINRSGDTAGDNRDMARARNGFLEKGYYGGLRDLICDTVFAALPYGGRICDAGCGEGYYLAGLTGQNKIEAWGFDISKNMLRLAGKRKNGANLFVAGVNFIPVKNSSFDLLLSVFAPICEGEFSRVLAGDGKLVTIAAGRRHLWQLKEVLYDKPYENGEAFASPKGFRLISEKRLNESITVKGQQDINALFSMTPYCYRTPSEGKERLKLLQELETEIDFVIRVFEKI